MVSVQGSKLLFVGNEEKLLDFFATGFAVAGFASVRRSCGADEN
jgi:hypothetical protein